eukprot:CAMPEP_0198294998 /NCGR_PEP_ID=MMETSP1449-20131203/25296_1 /TAXON_ID=420275 /ORGANISM="Attheya septentrionalis, Strain CCMP2084" /LENGTH=84 /DNA_ID=CAMNT_0043995143 /DNA_START=67 /DNA_END=318 /DNA_ORIENTATION=+
MGFFQSSSAGNTSMDTTAIPNADPATDSEVSSLASDDKGSWSEDDQSVTMRNIEGVQPHVGYKKVLVTGAAGFIGSHVCEYLLE